MKKFLALLITFIATASFAYIPPYWMIASRIADSRSDNFYKLEMEVVFNHEQEPKVIEERWFVYDANFMRLEVSSVKGFDQPFEATFVYRNGVRTALNDKGRTSNKKTGELFIEPLFHTRSDSVFKQQLVKMGLVSKDTLTSKPTKFDPSELESNKKKKKKDSKEETEVAEKKVYPKNPHVELSRVDGVVAYKMAAEASAESPAIWVEQDQFAIRKLLFPDKSLVRASDYTRSRGLSFPKLREFNWEDKNAIVRLNTIRTLSKSSKNKELVRVSSLKDTKSQLPEDKVILSFYSKFR